MGRRTNPDGRSPDEQIMFLLRRARSNTGNLHLGEAIELLEERGFPHAPPRDDQ